MGCKIDCSIEFNIKGKALFYGMVSGKAGLVMIIKQIPSSSLIRSR